VDTRGYISAYVLYAAPLQVVKPTNAGSQNGKQHYTDRS
jgi:hypothetical protein